MCQDAVMLMPQVVRATSAAELCEDLKNILASQSQVHLMYARREFSSCRYKLTVTLSSSNMLGVVSGIEL